MKTRAEPYICTKLTVIVTGMWRVSVMPSGPTTLDIHIRKGKPRKWSQVVKIEAVENFPFEVSRPFFKSLTITTPTAMLPNITLTNYKLNLNVLVDAEKVEKVIATEGEEGLFLLERKRTTAPNTFEFHSPKRKT